jgi:hypothetical protein
MVCLLALPFLHTDEHVHLPPGKLVEEVVPVAVGGILDAKSGPIWGSGPSTVKLSSPPQEFFLAAAGLASWLVLAAVAMVAGCTADGKSRLVQLTYRVILAGLNPARRR